MDVLAAAVSPMGPAIDTSTVKRRPRSGVLGAALALASLVSLAVPAIAQADTPPAQLPPKKGTTFVIRIERADAGNEHEAAVAKAPPTVDEKVRRGVVTIERAGQALGLGAVLMGDGRILSALSPLGAADNLEARFADGSVHKLKLGHADKAWDLALLVPQTGRWKEGLAASSRDPVRTDAAIRAFTLAAKKVAQAPMVVRSHKSLLGGDDSLIDGALELGSHVSPTDLGAPMVDEDGRVVGILSRGCAPVENRPCTPVAFGAPIGAIRRFLRTVPASAVQPSPFLGIQGAPETVAGVAKGVRVLGVAPHSPAEEAKIRGGDRDSDVILAVDGAPVTTPETLADAIRSHGIGEKVPVLLFSNGKYKDVNVVLRAPPEAKAAPPPADPAELPAAPPRRPAPRY